MHEGQKIIAVSYRSLEVYLAVAGIYLVMTGSTSWLLRRVEYRLSVTRRLA
jgi:polar amino acid transport system permease protein